MAYYTYGKNALQQKILSKSSRKWTCISRVQKGSWCLSSCKATWDHFRSVRSIWVDGVCLWPGKSIWVSESKAFLYRGQVTSVRSIQPAMTTKLKTAQRTQMHIIALEVCAKQLDKPVQYGPLLQVYVMKWPINNMKKILGTAFLGVGHGSIMVPLETCKE